MLNESTNSKTGKNKYHKKFDSDDSGSFERIGDLSDDSGDKKQFNMVDIESIKDMEGVNPGDGLFPGHEGGFYEVQDVEKSPQQLAGES